MLSSLQSSPKAAACVAPGCAAPEGHLPAGTPQCVGLVSSAGKSMSELEGKEEDLWGLLHSPYKSKGPHWFFCATTHPQAFCRKAGIGKGTCHTNTFPPALKPPSSFLRNFATLAAGVLQGRAHQELLCTGNRHVAVVLELPFRCNTGLIPGAHNYSAIWLFLTYIWFWCSWFQRDIKHIRKKWCLCVGNSCGFNGSRWNSSFNSCSMSFHRAVALCLQHCPIWRRVRFVSSAWTCLPVE